MSQQIEQKTIGTPNSDVVFPELYFFLYLNVPLSLCGIIANCVNIIVFSKQGLNTSVNLNLFSLAVADLGSLSSLFLESLSFKPALERAGIAYLTTELFYASSVTLRFLFARIAWWITTFISFERCLCVTLPLHIKQVLTTKRTVLAHAVIIASIITAVSPFLVARPLGSKLIPSINTTLIGLFYTDNGPYIERIAFCFNAILQFTSYILNIIFTTVIILQLNLNSRWRQNLSSLKDRSKRDKKLAKMSDKRRAQTRLLDSRLKQTKNSSCIILQMEDSGEKGGVFYDVQNRKELMSPCLEEVSADVEFDLDNLSLKLKNINPVCIKENSFKVLTSSAWKDIENIEKIIKNISFLRDSGLKTGIVLNQSKVSGNSRHRNKEGEILGIGINSPVIIVKDQITGEKNAQKTIMLAQFQGDQIMAWYHLQEKGLAPELYAFKMVEDQVVMNMEIIEGKTLQNVLDKITLSPNQAIGLSICVLDGLLSAYECLRQNCHSHNDMHAGNVMITPKLNIKVFDFDAAKKFLHNSQKLKDDMLEIIRMFCALYSGDNLTSRERANEILEARSLEKFSSTLTSRLTKDQRQELFNILLMLFDSVNTTHVSNYVKKIMPGDEMKKQIAVLLFPEDFQFKEVADCGTGSKRMRTDVTSVWEDPSMEDYVLNVTEQKLNELQHFVLAC
ncbi:growth hormone secretagogue receptor type 1 [Biomphalaria pfeifferi]|uniref:Growth hormone secretagogue receptor type 1 n=1 Tax=Biomphalaria pfeifferi TaxID=112525 RepID=A0AAD8FHR6_BIOPF|nr:growth hormone secretagogue receptor type 1 [Biomphalaria pfeifferi]